MPASDEELLLEQARRQRRSRKSGRALVVSLVTAAGFAVAGWLVIFKVRPVIKSIPLLPVGGVVTTLLWIGIGAFAIAAVAAAYAVLGARPGRPWGKPFGGKCPQCGQRRLREDTVEHVQPDAAGGGTGPKGVVIACDAPGCDYASALVTTPTRS